MRFEKLNENKIRILISSQDLQDKNIDFNSFMSNSIETQDLFLDMLAEAEERIGFVTKDYKIKIEALAMDSGDFVIIITRFTEKENQPQSIQSKNKKIVIKRKSAEINKECLVYSFKSFDDFCVFSSYTNNINNCTNIAKNIVLYTYNNNYYLLFSKINNSHPELKRFYNLITEFGTYINQGELFCRKLNERGKIVIKNNAIKTCNTYFSK